MEALERAEKSLQIRKIANYEKILLALLLPVVLHAQNNPLANGGLLIVPSLSGR